MCYRNNSIVLKLCKSYDAPNQHIHMRARFCLCIGPTITHIYIQQQKINLTSFVLAINSFANTAIYLKYSFLLKFQMKWFMKWTWISQYCTINTNIKWLPLRFGLKVRHAQQFFFLVSLYVQTPLERIQKNTDSKISIINSELTTNNSHILAHDLLALCLIQLILCVAIWFLIFCVEKETENFTTKKMNYTFPM